jgi:endogenous inhibitor of DNA gyrase (YacG/DUF329 family)
MASGSKSGERDACPVCGGTVAADARFRPFCRERCKMVDLGRWFRGEYVVAGEAAVAFDPDLMPGDEGGDPEQQG